MNKSYLEMLAELHEAGYTDEQVAVGIGDFLPGNSHPSASSVYRWRADRNRPSQIYLAFIELYWNQEMGA